MELFHTVILSIVEGISEFLPISSTGHLILTAKILGVQQTEFVKTFEIVIQLGAILAVAVLYWQRFLQSKRVWFNVAAAFIPTAIVGLTLYKLIKGFLLGNELITVAALLFGGVGLIILELLHKEKESHTGTIDSLTLKQSFLIGICQSLSVVPGVSRSAASIMGGLFLGTKRVVAVEFSFLIAIPTMLAASALDLFETRFAYTREEYLTLCIGFVISFFVALIVVRWFVRFVQTNTFIPFGIYRIILALLYFLFVL
jgi:undecaprenyl-diphosphatase